MAISSNLEALGISKEEYEVYKLLLSKASVGYTEIAKITGINRTSLYRIANSLEKKGLLVKRSDGQWEVVAPDRLNQLAKEKQEKVDIEVKEIGAEVKQLYEIVEKAKDKEQGVNFLEGIGNIATYNEKNKPLMYATEELTGFTFSETIPFLSKELDTIKTSKGNYYTKAMLKYGDKSIIPGTPEEIEAFRAFMKKYPILKGKMQLRYVDPEKFPIKAHSEFFNDYCLFYTMKSGKLQGYYIKNQFLAQTQRMMSLYVWEHAQPLF